MSEGVVERWIRANYDPMTDPEGVQVDAIPWGRLQVFARAHDAEDARRLHEHLRLVEQIQDRDAVIAQARAALRDIDRWFEDAHFDPADGEAERLAYALADAVAAIDALEGR